MKRRILWLILFTGLLALVACAAEEKATPAPTTPGAEARAAWEQEWERVLAAAKREGKVTVLGPTGAENRRALTEPFERKYGITVEFQGGQGPEQVAKLNSERAGGQHLWDIFIAGSGTVIPSLTSEGALDPIEPALILPEVTDVKSWLGEKLRFADEGRRVLVMSSLTKANVFINPSLAKAEEFKSYKDLLEPKWREKIIIHDPRIPGPGNATLGFFHQHKELGPDFIRALAAQKPLILRDTRQELEFVAQGRYPILIGGSDATASALLREGLPIAIVDHRQLKEKSYLTHGFGSVSMLSKLPHPNATKVYLNWLLSKEGQTEFNRALGFASRRLDVPSKDWVEPWWLPVDGYWFSDDEKGIAIRNDAVPFFKEVFKD
ncbi:MAG TPA: extracellular solute-binding protein [Dehalococcoidia bacterium]|nr:extracellular solute-binding protein [Dehalococcoidia bacterium]